MEEIIKNTSFTHRELAVSCFNKVWDLLVLENRSAKESEEMVHLCHVSFWHWTQVEEHTAKNLSIGYWQLARVYAVIGRGDLALNYAEKCIEVSNEANLEPFYKAYAYEAAARAYQLLIEKEKCKEMVNISYQLTEEVTDEDSKGWLIKDLETIQS